MKDIRLINLCDHRIFDEFITIEGVSPNFITYTKIPFNYNKNVTFIRDFNSTVIKEEIVTALDGITNFAFSTSNESLIFFGTDPVDSGMNFIDITSTNPRTLFLIDYISQQAYCPKCLGTGIMQDLTYDGTGEIVTTQSVEKVKQELFKVILTSLESNTYDQNYGSQLDNLIGRKLDVDTITLLQKNILDAVYYLMQLQQSKNAPDDERILKLAGISAVLVSPTLLQVTVTVLLATTAETSINFGVKL
jgi:hypothetical protein